MFRCSFTHTLAARRSVALMRALIWAELLGWCLAPSVCQGNPTSPDFRFVVRTWGHEDGLPQNTVTAVTQTRDGYIWVGTYNGLARFDGVKFTCFDSINTPEMRSIRVMSLFEDNAGALWIGYEGGELTRFADGKFQAVAIQGQWGTRSIHGIASDRAGDLWIFNHTDCMLARPRDGLVVSAESGPWGEWAEMASSPSGVGL